MTKHNFRLLDIYTDYLLSSFGATTATGLSALLPELSHDQVTRFLSQQPLSDSDLWQIIKPQIRAVESPDAVLIIDDTVQEKPSTDESELITWHYDHSQGRTVKGINLLSALYLSRDVSLPLAFELVQKTMLITDPKTGKDKWVCPQTKNDMARAMIASVQKKQVQFAYVLADVWFSSAENMVFIKQKAHKEFIFPLKKNRRVALSQSDKQRGRWSKLSDRDFSTQNDGESEAENVRTVYLESVPFPVIISRQVFKNEDGSEGVLLLCSSDLSLSGPALWTIYQKRWKVEEYHKSLKSNAALAKSPTKSPTKRPHTQQNHIFASLVAFVKLENYRTATHLNHFALKAKLYQGAIQTAFRQLQELKKLHSNTAITS